ncbi:MAG: hypothetical protein H7Z37_05370, partial [Pyrinomonadaceae bacterium]|nr:hypothetical protein [Pyrinomonadaceae bacterium]
MKLFAVLLLFIGFSVSVSAQTRQKALEKFNDLKRQAEIQEKIILLPEEKDFDAATKQNVGVFRILPREIYDKGLFMTRGGGAYYSFQLKASDYGNASDIELQQNSLSVGFAGANYGFIA